MSRWLTLSFVTAGIFQVVAFNTGCQPPPSVIVFPETCKDVQEQIVADTGSRPPDGTYTLYVNGDETMPWDAYCRRMNLSTPVEYLTVSEDNNFSQISNGQFVATTSYRRYRIDPIRLEIDPLDDTFATNDSGFDNFSPILPGSTTHIPAGWAEFQPFQSNDGPAAEANANLAGTGFVFSEEILANNLADFFCQVDVPEVSPSETAGTGASVDSDLTSFHLTAINANLEGMESGVSTREVADCANLGPSATTFDAGVWPLQYAGQ